MTWMDAFQLLMMKWLSPFILFSISLNFHVCFCLFYPLFCLFPCYMPPLYNFLTEKHYLKCCTFPYSVNAIWLWECAILLWREQRCLLVPLCPNLSLPSTCSLPFPGQSTSHYRCSIRQYLCTEQNHIEITLQSMKLLAWFDFRYSFLIK